MANCEVDRVVTRVQVLFRRIAKALLRRGLSFVDRHPQSRRYLLALLNRLGLYSIARNLYARSGMGFWGRGNAVPTDIAHLTPRARQIYADLKDAIAQHRKGDI